MNDVLKPLLENELLTDEAKEQITEAWALKEKEIREETETMLREEFTERYEHDKGILVTAVERMVEDGLTAEISEFVSDRNALTEQRVKLANEIREARINAKGKLAAQTKVLEAFVLNTLKKELGEFEVDRVQVREAKKELAKQLRESRVAYKKQLAENIKTMEEFVLGNLKKELTEFYQDKRALVNQRVKMIEEGKAKIEETRKEFIRRSANLVEGTVEDVLRKELTQFRDDIERSRQNTFGAQLFEAFVTEYKTSFFDENKIVNGLEKQLKESEKKFSKSKKLFEQSHKIAKSAQKRQMLAEGRLERESVTTELLNKLSGNHQEVMAELLEGIKTENLRDAFKKYIPAVTNGNGNTILSRKTSSPKTLNEGTKKVLTGDKRNKLAESIQAETEEETTEVKADIVDLQRLAGIH